MFRKELLDTLLKIDKDKNKKIIVSGHSLGAGISTVVGADLANDGYKVVVYNFASPRVGDQNFCKLISSLKLKIFRVVIPTLPPSVSPNFKDPENPYQYIHCGILKAFSDSWKSLLNNHLMGVYINALQNM